MFIVGSMDSLVGSGSSTWTNIMNDLNHVGNIGSKLELRCEVHGDITSVEKSEDFVNVPEGGCTQMCKKVLQCGHICDRICHSYDREHEDFKCTLPCIK